MLAFFFGRIIGSIVLIARDAHRGGNGLVAMAAGAAAALVFVTRVPVTMPHDPFTLFWSGAVAIMAMILPGISGSFLLLVLGQYLPVMEAVKALVMATLVPFALGCALGPMAFMRLLRWLLERWHGQTVVLLVGVMAGSLWKIRPFRTVLESTTNAKGKLIMLRDALAAPRSAEELAVALLLAALDVALVVGLIPCAVPDTGATPPQTGCRPPPPPQPMLRGAAGRRRAGDPRWGLCWRPRAAPWGWATSGALPTAPPRVEVPPSCCSTC